MIIGIDISSIPYGTGVSNYTLNLVRHLLKIDKENHYKLFFSSFRLPFPPELKNLKHPRLSVYRFHLPPLFFEFFWNTLHLLPIELFIGHCDIFHTWDWTQPPATKAKTVTTIHDFVPILFPKSQHPKTIKNFQKKLYWSIKECAHFICVSQNTRADLHRLYPHLDKSKTSVIYEAAEDKYSQFHSLPAAVREAKILAVKKIYDLDRYILVQGTREPRKNLSRLITVFSQYIKCNPKSRLELAIAGKYGWGNDVNRLKYPRVKILGYIPEKDMVALHAGALILACPSLYEGFGLPVLKSITLGVPVITSNISSFPEIVGPAALLISPTSTKNLFSGLNRLINSSSLRHRLSALGLIQAQKFSWDQTAKQTLNLYHQIISSSIRT